MPDFDQSAPAIIQLLIGLGCLLWIFNQVMIALGKRKTEQPFIVSLEEKFVSHDEHKDHASLCDRRFNAATASRKEIHRDVENLKSRTGRIEEQNKAQTDQLNLLSSDFRDFRREQNTANTEILKRLR